MKLFEIPTPCGRWRADYSRPAGENAKGGALPLPIALADIDMSGAPAHTAPPYLLTLHFYGFLVSSMDVPSQFDS